MLEIRKGYPSGYQILRDASGVDGSAEHIKLWPRFRWWSIAASPAFRPSRRHPLEGHLHSQRSRLS